MRIGIRSGFSVICLLGAAAIGPPESMVARAGDKPCNCATYKAVIFNSVAADPDLQVGHYQENLVAETRSDLEDAGYTNIEVIPGSSTTGSRQDLERVIKDPCLRALVIISHGPGKSGAGEEDLEWVSTWGSRDGAGDADIRGWLVEAFGQGAQGHPCLKELTLHSCGNKQDSWMKLFGVQEEHFDAWKIDTTVVKMFWHQWFHSFEGPADPPKRPAPPALAPTSPRDFLPPQEYSPLFADPNVNEAYPTIGSNSRGDALILAPVKPFTAPVTQLEGRIRRADGVANSFSVTGSGFRMLGLPAVAGGADGFQAAVVGQTLNEGFSRILTFAVDRNGVRTAPLAIPSTTPPPDADQTNPRLTALDPEGRFALAYEQYSKAGRVAVRVAVLDGQGRVLQNLPVSDSGEDATHPAIASNGKTAMVVWQVRTKRAGLLPDETTIKGAWVSWSAGTLVVHPAGSIAQSSKLPGTVGAPSVAANGEQFLIAFGVADLATMVDVYTSLGSMERGFAAPRLLTSDLGDQLDPQVAPAGSGYLVVWTDYPRGIGGNTDVSARFLNGKADSLGESFPVVAGTGHQSNPQLAPAWAGQVAVVWTDTSNFKFLGPAKVVACGSCACGQNEDVAIRFLPVAPSLLGRSPAVNDGGVVNAASFTPPGSPGHASAPGSIVSIFGANLAAATVEAQTIPLPTSLGGVKVTSNGKPAPLYFVSSGQINAQLPWDILPPGTSSGVAAIVVSVDGVAVSPRNVQLARFSPGVFTFRSGTGPAVAINANGTVAQPAGSIPGTPAEPARVGEIITVLATGLGPVDIPLPDGNNSLDHLRTTTTAPTVLIGGRAAPVLFSGLSPQFVGVYQLNITVPQDAPIGETVPLQIQVGGITSGDKVTIATRK
ncbi:MAG: hypothetical protein Q8N47_13790 [Bryobacterales bacterium]|nr:hypothetical protein [Bryobacterales bacterium]